MNLSAKGREIREVGSQDEPVTICDSQVLRNFKFELPSTSCTELLLTRDMVEDPTRRLAWAGALLILVTSAGLLSRASSQIRHPLDQQLVPDFQKKGYPKNQMVIESSPSFGHFGSFWGVPVPGQSHMVIMGVVN